MLQADDEVDLKLTASELSVVLELLGQAQYRAVATIIAKLTTQAQAQAQQTTAPHLVG
jgi:hypothetical protein